MEPGFFPSIRAKLARMSDARLLAILFLIAWTIRMLYLLEIRNTDFFFFLVGDGYVYDAWAQKIPDNWLGTEVFYQAPLYPYFLAAIYSIFGHDLFAVRVVQITLGSSACVLLALAGRLFFSSRVGLIAGLLLAVYPPAIFFDGLIQKASLDLFFMTALLLFLGKTECESRRRWPLLAGIALGCLALTRENALVLLPLIALWILGRFRGSCAAKIALFLLGSLSVLAPVAARNYYIGGEAFLTTSQFGPNFYIGNNASADGRYKPLRWGHGSALMERMDATEIAEQSAGRKLSAAEVSRFWTRRSTEWILAHPGDWLRLMARKWFLVWNNREIPDSDEPLVYEDASFVLALPGFALSFGTLCPIALAGVVATWKDRRRLAVLYLLLAGISLSVTLFFVFARYRFPMVPILALFAGAGVIEIIRLARQSRPDALAGYAALIIATVILVQWNMDPEENPRAMAYYNVGVSFDRQGDEERAAAYYRLSLDCKPDHAQAHINLGVILAGHGAVDDAIAHYREALRIIPNDPVIFNNLGNALAKRGNLEEAAGWLARAVAARPDNATFHSNLARIFAQQGKLAEAEAHYKQALKIQPDLPQAKAGLATLPKLKKTPRKQSPSKP